MSHDFSRGNRCRWCGANCYLADEPCSGDMGAAIDAAYDRYDAERD